jgi:hypothetical protein
LQAVVVETTALVALVVCVQQSQPQVAVVH